MKPSSIRLIQEFVQYNVDTLTFLTRSVLTFQESTLVCSKCDIYYLCSNEKNGDIVTNGTME